MPFGKYNGKIISTLIKNVNQEQKLMIYLMLFTKTIPCKVTASILKLYLLKIKNSGVIQANTCAQNTVIKIILHMIDQSLLIGIKKTRLQVMLQVFP